MAANKVTCLVYKRTDGKWAWNLRVGSDIIATDGGQGYENQQAAQERAEAVIGGGYVDADVVVRSRPSVGGPSRA